MSEDNKKIYCTHCGAENDFGVTQCCNCGATFGVKSSIFRKKDASKEVAKEDLAKEEIVKEEANETALQDDIKEDLNNHLQEDAKEPEKEEKKEDPQEETEQKADVAQEETLKEEDDSDREGASEEASGSEEAPNADSQASDDFAEARAASMKTPPKTMPKAPAKAGFGAYLGNAITHPMEAIAEVKDEHAKYGWIVLAVTALLPSLLVLLFAGVIFSFLKSSVLSQLGAEAYQLAIFLEQQMGMLFLLVLIAEVAEVMITLSIMYGISRGFGSQRNFKRWVAAYGSVRVLVFLVTLASCIVALIPIVGAVVAIPMSVVVSAGYCVLLYKCFVAEMEASPSKKFYGFCLGLLVTMAAITILVGIVCAAMIVSIAAGIGGYYNHYTW